MDSPTIIKLKKLLTSFIPLDKTSSDITRTLSSNETTSPVTQNLEEDPESSLTPQGSISEGPTVQTMPSSNFHPSHPISSPRSSKLKFAEEYKELLNSHHFNEALDSIQLRCRKMNTSLLQAAESNNPELCKLLMDKREFGQLVAIGGCRDANGNSPLHIASQKGHIKVCETLLDYGESGNIDLVNNFGQSALHLACERGFKEISQLLVRSGGNLNLSDMEGNTPAHLAMRSRNSELIEWILSRNPDMSLKNNQGKTLADLNEESVLIAKEPQINQVLPTVKSFDFLGMIQKLNNLIKKTPSTEELEIVKLTPSTFRPIQLLGKGSFGEVYLVEKKDTSKLYAMKILMKTKIMGQNLIRYALTERNVMSYIRHPFIVALRYSFQTANKLYLILDYCPGGSLSSHLKREKHFTEDKAKGYICEILLALEELHRRNIIYRDLKPDNIVIDREGHALLTDFGLSKEGVQEKDSARSFCGSVAYLPPEMLQRAGHGKAVDWYLLGVLLYEMLVGCPPFYSKNRNELFYNIKKGKLRVPSSLSSESKNLLKDLLQKDPNKRLGAANDAEEVKSHEYFKGIDWALVLNRGLRTQLPAIPAIPAEYLQDSVIGDVSDENGQVLPGWTFVSN